MNFVFIIKFPLISFHTSFPSRSRSFLGIDRSVIRFFVITSLFVLSMLLVVDIRLKLRCHVFALYSLTFGYTHLNRMKTRRSKVTVKFTLTAFTFSIRAQTIWSIFKCFEALFWAFCNRCIKPSHETPIMNWISAWNTRIISLQEIVSFFCWILNSSALFLELRSLKFQCAPAQWETITEMIVEQKTSFRKSMITMACY